MPIGESHWKMLRPMSTPDAPRAIALHVIVSASRSGSFLPPAMTTGTGHVEVMRSKSSST